LLSNLEKGRTVLSRALALVLPLAAVSIAAAEVAPPPSVKPAKEAMPAIRQATGTETKPLERKTGEDLKSPRRTPKPPQHPPPHPPEEKTTGLGCAEN
jgi:hypothetical protein